MRGGVWAESMDRDRAETIEGGINQMINLNGAWEPRGYVGPRVEINENEMVRLWKNRPVLVTTFTVEEAQEQINLTLAETELRNSEGEKPYATVKECFLRDGTLVFVDDFTITGESREELMKTENSRYGNVVIVDDQCLSRLQGEWQCDDGYTRIAFQGNKMRFGYGEELPHEVEIITVKYRSESEGERFYIRNRDPAMDGVGMFGQITCEGQWLHTYIPVCDARPADMLFKKIEMV